MVVRCTQSTGAGATYAFTMTGVAWESAGAGATWYVTGAGVDWASAGAGATCSITGAGVAKKAVRHRRFQEVRQYECHMFDPWS